MANESKDLYESLLKQLEDAGLTARDLFTYSLAADAVESADEHNEERDADEATNPLEMLSDAEDSARDDWRDFISELYEDARAQLDEWFTKERE